MVFPLSVMVGLHEVVWSQPSGVGRPDDHPGAACTSPIWHTPGMTGRDIIAMGTYLICSERHGACDAVLAHFPGHLN
jgi:hypothetical protein